MDILNPEELQESLPKSPFLDSRILSSEPLVECAKVLSAKTQDGHHLVPTRDDCGIALNTDPSHTSAQAPTGLRNTGLSFLKMTSSYLRWQLLWGRFGEGHLRLGGGQGTVETENPSQGGRDVARGGTTPRLQTPKHAPFFH